MHEDLGGAVELEEELLSENMLVSELHSQCEVKFHTLSPQMVMRDHVRILWKTFMAVFHVSVCDMFWMKFVFWRRLGSVLRPGTWKFRVVDLNR